MIQPERRASETYAISFSEISGGENEIFIGRSKCCYIDFCENQNIDAIGFNKKSGQIKIVITNLSEAEINSLSEDKFYIVGRFEGDKSSFSFQVSSSDLKNKFIICEDEIDIFIVPIISPINFFKRYLGESVKYEISLLRYI